MRYVNLTAVQCSVRQCVRRSTSFEPHLTQAQVAAALRKESWLVIDVIEATGRDPVTIAICPSCAICPNCAADQVP